MPRSSQEIKHVFQFAEERRTLWLNTHVKDFLGRHRGCVLYGFEVKVRDNDLSSVEVGPGAAYTAFGTRLIVEVHNWSAVGAATPPNVVSLSQYFSPAMQASYPIVVGIFMRLIMDPTNSPNISDATDFGSVGAPVAFTARQIPFHIESVIPAHNIAPRNPISLEAKDATDRDAYASTAAVDWRDADVAYVSETGAVQFGEIPLACVIITRPAGGPQPINLKSAGVTIVQCRNAFESIQDILGFPAFYARSPLQTAEYTEDDLKRLAFVDGFGPNLASTSSMLAPRYGVARPKDFGNDAMLDLDKFMADEDRAVWKGADWRAYRPPSFLKDGDSILWALRRLDYVLRLWLDRTGDQELLEAIHFGTGLGSSYGKKQYLNLDAISRYFSGSDSASNNKNVITYLEPASSPFNSVLQSGYVTHARPSSLAHPNEARGDSHREALSALNAATYHVLEDIFGISATKENLRRSTSWRGLSDPVDLEFLRIADGPIGRRWKHSAGGYPKHAHFPDILTKPAFNGVFAPAYFTTETVYAAVSELADRAQHATNNWLRNPTMAIWRHANSAYVIDGDWRTVNVVATPIHIDFDENFHAVKIVKNAAAPFAAFYQDVVFEDSTDVSHVLRASRLWHIAACMKPVSGFGSTAVRLSIQLVGYDVDDPALQSELAGFSNPSLYSFKFVISDISPDSYYNDYTATIQTMQDAAALLNKRLRLRFAFVMENTGPAELHVHGASFGPGMPGSAHSYHRTYHEFLSRYGGPTTYMRGPLFMGKDAQSRQDIAFANDIDAINVYAEQKIRAGTDLYAQFAVGDGSYRLAVLNSETRISGPVYIREFAHDPSSLTYFEVTLSSPSASALYSIKCSNTPSQTATVIRTYTNLIEGNTLDVQMASQARISSPEIRLEKLSNSAQNTFAHFHGDAIDIYANTSMNGYRLSDVPYPRILTNHDPLTVLYASDWTLVPLGNVTQTPDYRSMQVGNQHHDRFSELGRRVFSVWGGTSVVLGQAIRVTHRSSGAVFYMLGINEGDLVESPQGDLVLCGCTCTCECTCTCTCNRMRDCQRWS